MSSLRRSQANSIIKTNHGDSIRDSELQTHQIPTDTITDRKGTSGLIYHAPIYAIIDKLITNKGSKVKRSVGGHVTIRRTWCIFYGPCRRQKTAGGQSATNASIRDQIQQTSLTLIKLSALSFLILMGPSEAIPKIRVPSLMRLHCAV
jgi:hypothetical protein